MSTRTQRSQKMDAEREQGPLPRFVPGTETDKPGRAERRRIERILRHERNMKIARLTNG